MIRAAFLGTPEDAVPVLVGLLEVAEVSLVITQPDRPRGRSGFPEPPPVKKAAVGRGLHVIQPSRLIDTAGLLSGLDVAVLAAYGRLVPRSLLSVPRRGFVNMHYSLLPRWRGASPVVRAILAGDATTGVTMMEMDEGLDTGAVIASRSTPIRSDEDAGALTARLAAIAGRIVAELLPGWVRGELAATPQDDAGATAAAKITVDEAFVVPRLHRAEGVRRAIRAFNPRPGAWGVVDGERIKLWKAGPVDGAGAEPGVAVLRDGRVFLGCVDGPVELIRVQPAGRAEMGADAWMNGRRGAPARFD